MLDPRLRALARYRLEADLSYVQLAAQIQQAGFDIRMRSLFNALTGRLRNGPRERTLYKLQCFVEQMQAKRALAEKRRRQRQRQQRQHPRKKLRRAAA